MNIKFDGYTFNAIQYKDEIFVLIDDVRNFIDKNMSFNTILGNAIYVYRNYRTINIKHYLYTHNDNYYINWNIIIILTMKFNTEKYIKYKNILETQLNYSKNGEDIMLK